MDTWGHHHEFPASYWDTILAGAAADRCASWEERGGSIKARLDVWENGFALLSNLKMAMVLVP